MIHITNHAAQRWAERFGQRFVMRDILDEFKRAEKYNANRARQLGVRIEPGRRYYVTPQCIFVVATDVKVIVTILPRR